MNHQQPFLKRIAQQFATAFIACMFIITIPAKARQAGDTTVKPGGHLWGLAYGDLAFKAETDLLNRGGLNQYTGIKKNESLFQFRRVYLGFDYEINKQFSANFLLANEENGISSSAQTPVASGDLLTNTKNSMFIKIACATWKNIFPKANLSFGMVNTPSAVLLVEQLWDYRCIERTISELRRTPVYDFGAILSGKIYDSADAEVGYNIMVGNGTLAKPENDQFKWFYGDVYAKLFNKKLVVDLYGDYTRVNWTPTWHHQRYMVKATVGYTTPKFTIATEAFYNTLTNDNIGIKANNMADTINTQATGISVFAHGRVYKDVLGFFARFDNYDPSGNNNNGLYTKYTPLTSNYNVNTKEQFITAGLDYTPNSKIHIMPNVWYTKYQNATADKINTGHDVVYRLSLYYVYGK